MSCVSGGKLLPGQSPKKNCSVYPTGVGGGQPAGVAFDRKVVDSLCSHPQSVPYNPLSPPTHYLSLGLFCRCCGSMAISRRRSTSEPRSSFECDAAPSTSTWRMTPYRSTNPSKSTLAFPKVGIIMKIMATEGKLMLYMLHVTQMVPCFL